MTNKINTNLTDLRKKNYIGSHDSTVSLTNDVSQATSVTTITGEALTLSAGAAGTTGKVRVALAPVMDSIGANIGYFISSGDKDTSVSVTGGTTLTGDHKPFNRNLSDVEVYASLDNGDYTFDHAAGVLYYKKADSGTSVTIDYKYTVSNTGGAITASNNIKELNGVTLVADNAVAPTTDYPVPIGGTYNATKPTYSDGDRVVSQYDSSGNLKVTGGASSVTADYTSPIDFTASNTSSTTITLTGLPITITDSSQIAYIKVIPNTGDAQIFVNGADGVTIKESAGVLTISGAGTPFATNDVYQVGINGQKKSYDASSDTTKVLRQDLDRPDYTDYYTLVTASDIGATDDTWKDQGGENIVSGVSDIGVDIAFTANNSSGCQVQFLVKYEYGGTDEFNILDPRLGMLHLNSRAKTSSVTDDSDSVLHLNFGCKGIKSIQIQTKATDVDTGGGTEGTVDIQIQKFYGSGSYLGLSSNEYKKFIDEDVDKTAQVMKTDRGVLKKLHIINTNSAAAYVKLFDLASGSVTVGTTKADYVIMVPAEGAVIEDFPNGFAFDNAITYTATTSPLSTDDTDPTTGLVLSGLYI